MLHPLLLFKRITVNQCRKKSLFTEKPNCLPATLIIMHLTTESNKYHNTYRSCSKSWSAAVSGPDWILQMHHIALKVKHKKNHKLRWAFTRHIHVTHILENCDQFNNSCNRHVLKKYTLIINPLKTIWFCYNTHSHRPQPKYTWD